MHDTLESLTLAHADETRALLVISHGGSMRLFLDRTLGRLVPPVPNVGIYLVPHDGERFSAASLLDEQED
jgi:broad specificity phosphatase PhoE